MSTPLHMNRLWNRKRRSPSMTLSRFLLVSNISPPGRVNPIHTNFKYYTPLAAKNLSISLGLKNPNILLNICKCSTEKTPSTRDIGTQLYVNAIQSPVHCFQVIKKSFMSPSGIEPATHVLCHNISVTLPTLLCSSYFQDRILHT